MDGTLYDCSGAIEEAYARASKILSEESGTAVPAPAIETIRSVLGNTMDNFFLPLFPSLGCDWLPRIDEVCTHELMINVRAGKGELYNGVHDLFEKLKSRGWGILIASNGQREYLDAILETYDLRQFIAHDPVTVNYSSIKSKGGILAEYIKTLDIKEQLVMVGDRKSDMTAARENNAFFIGCAFGHAGDDEIAGSDAIVSSMDEITEISSLYL